MIEAAITSEIDWCYFIAGKYLRQWSKKMKKHPQKAKSGISPEHFVKNIEIKVRMFSYLIWLFK